MIHYFRFPLLFFQMSGHRAVVADEMFPDGPGPDYADPEDGVRFKVT